MIKLTRINHSAVQGGIPDVGLGYFKLEMQLCKLFPVGEIIKDIVEDIDITVIGFKDVVYSVKHGEIIRIEYSAHATLIAAFLRFLELLVEGQWGMSYSISSKSDYLRVIRMFAIMVEDIPTKKYWWELNDTLVLLDQDKQHQAYLGQLDYLEHSFKSHFEKVWSGAITECVVPKTPSFTLDLEVRATQEYDETIFGLWDVAIKTPQLLDTIRGSTLTACYERMKLAVQKAFLERLRHHNTLEIQSGVMKNSNTISIW